MCTLSLWKSIEQGMRSADSEVKSQGGSLARPVSDTSAQQGVACTARSNMMLFSSCSMLRVTVMTHGGSKAASIITCFLELIPQSYQVATAQVQCCLYCLHRKPLHRYSRSAPVCSSNG